MSTFVTQAAFIGDNERKRWDASLPRPSPPRCSFISPSYKAESPPATSAACCIENRQQSVWDKKLAASCGHRHCSAPGWRREVPRALAGPTPICVRDIGMHVKSISSQTPLMKVLQTHKFVGIFNSKQYFKALFFFLVHFNHSEVFHSSLPSNSGCEIYEIL